MFIVHFPSPFLIVYRDRLNAGPARQISGLNVFYMS